MFCLVLHRKAYVDSFEMEICVLFIKKLCIHSRESLFHIEAQGRALSVPGPCRPLVP